MFIRINDHLAVNPDNVSGIEEYEGTDRYGVILFFADGYRTRVPNVRLDDILSTLAGEAPNGADHIRANPDKCLHRVIQGVWTPDGWMDICVSCDSTISTQFIRESMWEYDINTNFYVWKKEK